MTLSPMARRLGAEQRRCAVGISCWEVYNNDTLDLLTYPVAPRGVFLSSPGRPATALLLCTPHTTAMRFSQPGEFCG